MPYTHGLLGEELDLLAPDGSEVRLLTSLGGGSMAHFTLPVGKTSLAVEHRTIEELWYVTAGQGEMWRRQDDHEEITTLQPGLSLTVPLGTRFQFRNPGGVPLAVVIVTMPPWPGADEAVMVAGRWDVRI